MGSEVLHEKNVMPITYVPNALKISIKVIGQLSDELEIKLNKSETTEVQTNNTILTGTDQYTIHSVWHICMHVIL